MRQELQQVIFDRFPSIFSCRSLSPKQTCMAWGIECPDAWFPIIYSLCERLTKLGAEYGVVVVANQVKEKYGTLRFYHSIHYGPRWTTKVSKSRGWLGVQWLNIRDYINGWLRRFKLKPLPYTRLRYVFRRLDGRLYTDCVFKDGWESYGKVLVELDVDARVEHAINFACSMSGIVCCECGCTGSFSNPIGYSGWGSRICKSCVREGRPWSPMLGHKEEDE